jgi:hypothetical protein
VPNNCGCPKLGSERDFLSSVSGTWPVMTERGVNRQLFPPPLVVIKVIKQLDSQSSLHTVNQDSPHSIKSHHSQASPHSSLNTGKQVSTQAIKSHQSQSSFTRVTANQVPRKPIKSHHSQSSLTTVKSHHQSSLTSVKRDSSRGVV